MAPSKVLIWWDTTLQGYVMASSYNETFQAAWKEVIPVGARHWDKEKKLWFLTEHYGDVAQRIAVAIFGQQGVSFKSKAETEAKKASVVQSSTNGLGKSALTFLSLLDYEEARSLYRKALLRLHPDRGGSTEKSAQLNDSWKEIEREIYKRG
jgi:hypothetical protein